MKYQLIKTTDPQIYKQIKLEEKRQIEGIELIASENYTSEAVLEAMGSILTNKYSEGYIRNRYYSGCEFIDNIEEIAIERAKKLFGAEHANVQPYSGSPANLAVYLAFLEREDKVMGMHLYHGGHLTHGFKVSITGRYFNSIQYGVTKDGYIDYKQVEELAIQHKPKLIISGATAYPRFIDYEKFREICDKVGAIMVVDMAHVAGLVAGGVHPNPVQIADVVTTTCHKTLRGPRAGMILCKKKYSQQIDKAVFPGLQGGPHNHITAGVAVALQEASQDNFKQYAKQVVINSQILAKHLLNNGFNLATKGTDNHLLLMDVTNIDDLTGKIASDTLEKVNISVNKNTIPNDPRSPMDPSGIRIGTPAITTRGLKEKDMKFVSDCITKALKNYKDEKILDSVKQDVFDYMVKFPIPGINHPTV